MRDGLFPARLLNPIENNFTALQFVRLNLGYHIVLNSTHSLLFIVILLLRWTYCIALSTLAVHFFLGLLDVGKQFKGSYFSVLA